MLHFLLLFACNNDSDINAKDLSSTAVDSTGANGQVEEVSYSLTVNSPMYGSFYGEGPIPVAGQITPPDADLFIEGEKVEADEEGFFSYEVPFEKQYAIIDVELPQGDQKERIPVFSGQHPNDTWPGSLTARLLPAGLDKIGNQLGAMIDDSGWADTIANQLPEADWGWAGMRPVAFLHEPTVVAMEGAEDGVAIDFTLNGIGIEYEFWFNDFDGVEQASPIMAVFEEVAIGATTVPLIDEDGIMIFSLVDADLTMGAPDFQFGNLEGWVLEWILQQGWSWILEPLSEWLIDAVLGELGELEIGGPFAFESDLMGSPLGIELYDVHGDPEGLALGLEMYVGDLSTNEDAENTPIPGLQEAPEAQLAIAIHEALFQQLLSEQLLGLLQQDLDLGGAFGDILGGGIVALPGGDEAPDGDGWCIELDPNSASVVRLQDGIEPLVKLYIPDMELKVGIKQGNDCDTWVRASLAAEIGLEVTDGSKLGVDFEIAEGALLFYGASDYDEEEVIIGLSSYLENMLGLIGGFAEFDLAEILGGGEMGEMGDLSLTIVDSKTMDRGEDGIEGLFAISLNIWSE